MVRTARLVLWLAASSVGHPAPAPTSRPQPVAALTGTYRHERSRDYTFQILVLPDGRLRVGFDGTNGVNFGRLFGTAVLDGSATSFVPHDGEGCRIHLQFAPGTLTVRQDGHSAVCGLGHGVTADGTYKRRSGKPPRFAGFEGEDPFAGRP